MTRNKNGKPAVKTNKVKRGILMGILAAAALAATDAVLEYNDCGIFSSGKNTTADVQSEKTPNSQIYRGSVYDKPISRDQYNKTYEGMLRLVKETYPEKYKNIVSSELIEWNSISCVEPISTKIDLQNLERITNDVEKAIEELGFDAHYEINLMTSESNVSADADRINFSQKLGNKIRANFRLTYKDGSSFEQSVNAFEGKNGYASIELKIEKGKIISAQRKGIYVAIPNDYSELYHTLCVEIVHDKLHDAANALFNELSYDPDNNANIEYAQLAALVATNESVAHGIRNCILEKNLEHFGMSKAAYDKLVASESDFQYKGATTVSAVARQMGLETFVQDYMKNPMKYWILLKENVPEYRALK